MACGKSLFDSILEVSLYSIATSALILFTLRVAVGTNILWPIVFIPIYLIDIILLAICTRLFFKREHACHFGYFASSTLMIIAFFVLLIVRVGGGVEISWAVVCIPMM